VIKVIWGSNKEKPIASKQLASHLSQLGGVNGFLYIGYPIIGSPKGPMKFDAILLSEELGVIAFDIIENVEIALYMERQDEIASMLDVKLKPYENLKHGRNLKFEINTVTFAPSIKRNLPQSHDLYNVCNNENFIETINSFEWGCDNTTFKSLLAAIQVVTNIRAGNVNREIKNPNSLGAKLKKLEESIANLDQHQSEAVIETVEGVQRIRGLAGSGKTIVLALKVAYLHSQNPDWKIAVTFHTRALKEQFNRLINNFTIEQIGTEPDWSKIDIVNSWGAPGSKHNDGIYHMFCEEHSINYLDYTSAKDKYGDQNSFSRACELALSDTTVVQSKYDVILVDEAQDFPPSFLRLCYQYLKTPKRLVYAYDELQSLSGHSVLPPDQLFGLDEQGAPNVILTNDDQTQAKKDIVLQKCYRNSRPLLASAHSLGFGLNREKGIVQIFDDNSLWKDVGYKVTQGDLIENSDVELIRTSESSPLFLEEHSEIEDLIKFEKFSSKDEMDEFLINEIERNIKFDELRPEDILVINPNPLTTKKNVGQPRVGLLEKGINSEIAGVTTSRDVFSRRGAVTFTGIFRAKGNEAGMVYIMNGQDCFDSWDPNTLSLFRNRLFTAITRSKGWVRVLGIGDNMDGLIKEWKILENNKFSLKFKYPTEAEKKRLKLINKDMPAKDKIRHNRVGKNLKEFVDLLNAGEISVESLSPEILEALSKIKNEI